MNIISCHLEALEGVMVGMVNMALRALSADRHAQPDISLVRYCSNRRTLKNIYMGIKQERNQMGFTQEELALYLGVDRTQLTKTERGKRVIPYRSLGKWLQLRKCLDNEDGLKETASKVLEQQQERLASFVKRQQCLLSCNVAILELRLNRMEATYQGCLRALAFAAQLRQQHALKEEEELPMAHLEARSAKKMGGCGLDKQAALFMKLQATKQMQQELAAFNKVFLHPKNRQL